MCPSKRGKHRRAGHLLGTVGQEQRAGVADFAQPLLRHREHADFVSAAKAVFVRAQDAILVAALALKRQHGIDHMFQHARASDAAILGDMADKHQRRAAFLGKTDQFLRRART